jgi:glutamate formiminotransferase / formiminotetrahydrofolate cyclodeaminase
VTTLSTLVQRDSDAYGAVSAAYRMPTEPEDAANKRSAAITDALLGAAEVPLETARACAQVAELAAVCANKGNTNAVSDAGVAALLADAACRGAVYNVRINISSLEDKSRGKGLIEEANQLLGQARKYVDEATSAVEKAIGG